MIVCKFVIRLYLETNISAVDIIRNEKLDSRPGALKRDVRKSHFAPP